MKYLLLLIMLSFVCVAAERPLYLDVKTITNIKLTDCVTDKKVERRFKCAAVVDVDGVTLDKNTAGVQRSTIEVEK